MLNVIALITSLGVGGVLGAYAKGVIDKQHLMFSKLFDYKERRYQAITIQMLTTARPSQYELAKVKMFRPDIREIEDLHKELETEYYNAMIYASDEVLRCFAEFLEEKSLANYRAVAQAMRKDLYL